MEVLEMLRSKRNVTVTNLENHRAAVAILEKQVNVLDSQIKALTESDVDMSSVAPEVLALLRTKTTATATAGSATRRENKGNPISQVILRVLSQSPKPLTKVELAKATVDAGYVPGANHQSAIYQACMRLKNEGKVQYNDDRTWQVVVDSAVVDNTSSTS